MTTRCPANPVLDRTNETRSETTLFGLVVLIYRSVVSKSKQRFQVSGPVVVSIAKMSSPKPGDLTHPGS
jgi:hypothetical protein